MKYCPTCQSHFNGDEVFCPHDGTRLLAEGSYQVGRLAGSSLGGIVNLEAFLFADHIGERYRGQLLSDNSEVQVLVFHRRYDKERIYGALHSLQALGPLPSQILSTHFIIGDSEPLFLVEERPQKESLAHLLKKKGPLPWRQAVHLTIKLARILDWLASEGLAHRALHTRSIFVDNPAVNPIQVGELAAGLITFPLPRLEDDPPRGSLPVYAGYLAPEWITNPTGVDLQLASTYSLGAILLEALGAPILPEQGDSYSIKQWLDKEIAPTLELELAADAPAALQGLATMLASPNTESRFQSVTAAMAALSSLIDDDLDAIAPPLAPRSEEVFSTKPRAVTQPIALPDSSKIAAGGAETVGRTRVTHIGLPTRATTENSESDPSGLVNHSPKVITEGSEDNGELYHGDTIQMKAADLAQEVSKEIAKDSNSASNGPPSETPDPAPAHTTDESSDEDIFGSTLLMGAAAFEKVREDAKNIDSSPKKTSDAELDSSPMKNDGESRDDTKDDDIEMTDGSKTRQLHPGDVQAAIAPRDAHTPPENTETPSDSEDTEKSSGDPNQSTASVHSASTPQEKASTTPMVSGESVMKEGTPHPPNDKPSVIVDSHQGDVPKVVIDMVDHEANAAKPEADEEDDKEESTMGHSSADEVDAQARSDDASAQNDEAKEEEPDQAKSKKHDKKEKAHNQGSDRLEIGFIEAKSNSTDDFTDNWFTRSNQDSWEESLVQEVYMQAQRRERATRIGFIIGALLLTAFVVIFTLTYEPVEETLEPIAEVETASPEVDVAELKDRFSRALDAGRIIQPRPQSALQALREIRRHGSPEEYDDARMQFVHAADAAGRQAEANGDLFHARNLSGYASQYEPEDADLRARAEVIQARYLALQEGTTELADDEADTTNDETDAVNSPGREERSDEQTSTSSPSTSPRPSASPAALFQQAQAANETRDYEKARSLYLELLQIVPDHVEGNAHLAKLYFDVDADHRSAIRYQRRAVEGAPTNVDYRVQLGRLHFRLAEYEEAITIWEEVLKLDPNHSEAQRWIGLARRSMN